MCDRYMVCSGTRWFDHFEPVEVLAQLYLVGLIIIAGNQKRFLEIKTLHHACCREIFTFQEILRYHCQCTTRVTVTVCTKRWCNLQFAWPFNFEDSLLSSTGKIKGSVIAQEKNITRVTTTRSSEFFQNLPLTEIKLVAQLSLELWRENNKVLCETSKAASSLCWMTAPRTADSFNHKRTSDFNRCHSTTSKEREPEWLCGSLTAQCGTNIDPIQKEIQNHINFLRAIDPSIATR